MIYERPSDQWNHEGICGNCRKQNYCGKNCKAKQKRIEMAVQRAIANLPATRAITSTLDNFCVERTYYDPQE